MGTCPSFVGMESGVPQALGGNSDGRASAKSRVVTFVTTSWKRLALEADERRTGLGL
jgi:hypothetical protein